MWRMKVLAVTVVVLGALMFGAVVAYAGWSWNAKVDIGGTKISTSWAVTDDVNGAANYSAVITIAVPDGTDVKVIKTAPNEDVNVTVGGSCSNGVLSATISYLISNDGGGDGLAVSVSVDQVGHGSANFGSGSGTVGIPIPVNVPAVGTC